jgi:hypothetical protein
MNFALPYVIDNGDDLDYICSLVKDPLPPCWNPYAATGYLGQLIQGLVPTIQKERPEIMQKLAKMALPMTDILESATEACRPIEDFD